MSLRNILNGYSNYAKKSVGSLDPDITRVAKARLRICQLCDTLSSNGLVCDKAKGGCGCVIKPKAYCENCKCPKDKW